MCLLLETLLCAPNLWMNAPQKKRTFVQPVMRGERLRICKSQPPLPAVRSDGLPIVILGGGVGVMGWGGGASSFKFISDSYMGLLRDKAVGNHKY